MAIGKPTNRGASTRALHSSSSVFPVALSLLAWLMTGPASAEPQQGVGEAAQPTQESTPVVSASLEDGLSLRASDAFGAQLRVAAWTRFVGQGRDGQPFATRFEVPLARALLHLKMLQDRFHLWLMPEFAGDHVRLLDLAMDWSPAPEVSLRAGQFRTPYSRAYLTPIVQLSMSDRGIVSNHFRAGRDTGLMVFGHLGTVFEYNLGIFNGARINDLNDNAPTPMGVARVVLTPYGTVPYDQAPAASGAFPHGLAIGLASLVRERQRPAEQDSQDAVALRERTLGTSADVALVEGPLSLFSEGFWQRQRFAGLTTDSAGAFVQAGLFVVPSQLQLSARAEVIDPDLARATGTLQAYGGAIKGYLESDGTAYGHHASLTLHYRYVRSAQEVGQIAPGDAHRLVLQLQLLI